MENLDIFIGAYKEFQQRVKNDSYKIIVGNHDINNNSSLTMYKCQISNDKLDDRFYSEIYMLKCIIDKIPLKEYVGFCHYRKYFDFMDDIPDMDSLFKEYDVICARKITFKTTVLRHYGMCHYSEDLNIVGNIIKEHFHDYYDAYNTVMNQKWFYPYNMVIMKKNDYIEYINFIYNVLQKYIQIVGTDIKKRIEDKKTGYLKRMKPNNTIEYQYRIGGYLAERLTNVFITKKFKKVKEFNVKITESKKSDIYSKKNNAGILHKEKQCSANTENGLN